MKRSKNIDYKNNIKEYWNLIKKYKYLALVLIILVIFGESIVIGEKYLFKGLIENIEKFVSLQIIQSELLHALIIIGIIFILLVIIDAVNEWSQFKLIAKLDTSVNADIKRKYFSHIVNLHYGFHTTHKTGSMISRLSRGTNAVSTMTESLIWQISPLMIQLAILIPAFTKLGSWQGLILGITSISYISYSVFISKVCYDKDRKKENEMNDIEKANVSDMFTNIESIKLFGKEKRIVSLFEKITEDVKGASLKAWRWWAWYNFGQILIFGLGMFAIFFTTIKQFLNGLVTLGEITFIYTTFIGILGPLNRFSWGIRNLTRSLNDVQDLFEYSLLENEIKDIPRAKELKINEPKIRFKNVSFSYEDEKILFENFNLEIPANKKVALVGRSGCGKTSLVKLLYRLYDIDSGEILIDNENIAKVKQESLRESMSIVPQEAILFDDTIYNNIKFANPKATKKEILNAIKLAHLDAFVDGLPKKYNTIVGERGVKLSGGQKQRVSIARAILANKKILVLDEATSALDSETEHEIQKGLAVLMRNRTSIVIAHRLSTIMNADIIVVLDEGKIVQKGTHRELISQSEEYANLWELQKGGFLQD